MRSKLPPFIAAVVLASIGTPAYPRASTQQAAGRMSLPAPTGIYGVGRASYALTDEHRPEPLSKTPGARRPSTFRGIDSLPRTDVVEDAPIAAGKQPFPLLIFSHGWGNPTFLYTAELEDIVSHGYMVMAVDHPYDTSYTLFPDGHAILFAQDRFDRETKKPNGLINYAKERVEVMGDDNKFALAEILRYAHTRSLRTPFHRRIDEHAIGAFGHSIGGLAAARTCQIDARVKACMDQDSDDGRGSPFIVTPLGQTEKQPFMLSVVASADLWSPATTNPSDADLAAQKMTRPAYLALLKEHQANQTYQLAGIPGGSFRIMLFALPGFIHRSFTDQTLLDFSRDEQGSNFHNFQIAQAYLLAFFDKYLRKARHTVLDAQAPVDPRVKVERFPAHEQVVAEEHAHSGSHGRRTNPPPSP